MQCFRYAIRNNSNCLMAYWGLAYALGPNYNKPWEIFDKEELERNLREARAAIGSAKQQSAAVERPGVEAALVDAVGWRYQESDGSGQVDRSRWNVDYAKAMEDVYHRFSDDLDVAALYADALMNLTPWSLWDLKTGEPTAGSRTLEAKDVLDRAMGRPGGSEHPGLLHLYIHLMEMSSSPETALPAADALRDLVPDAGHLHHMPTHIDVLCGDYAQVVTSNSRAIAADSRWVKREGALNFYSLYRAHNYHFKIYGAMFAGMSRVALETAAELEDAISDALLRIESPPMADWLEAFLTMRLHVLVRFGRWEDILALELPEDKELYCVTIAMAHYARGIASANTSNQSSASDELASFLSAVENVPESRTLFNNTAQSLLTVAQSMLEGEISYHQGVSQGNKELIETAFTHLTHSMHLSDTLPYDEPWGWMTPPRHAYGALLLDQNRVEEAMAVYKADLGLDETLPRALRHPKNIWALSGLKECLVKLGREEEANGLEEQVKEAGWEADVEVRASCYCRKGNARVEIEGGVEVQPWRFNKAKRKDG